jgi:hypothetical protein
MDSDANRERQRRATFVALMLAVSVFGGCLLFATALTSGVVLLVPLAAASLGGVAFVHYLLWGRALTRDTAEEREDEERRQVMEVEEWDVPRLRPPREL